MHAALSLLLVLALASVAAARTDFSSFVTPSVGYNNSAGYSYATGESTGIFTLTKDAPGVTTIVWPEVDDSQIILNTNTTGFSFPWYGVPFGGEDQEAISLSTNGVIGFGDNVRYYYGAFCGYGSESDDNSNDRLIAFGQEDLTWGTISSDLSHALYRVFTEGDCPYQGRESQRCLVVTFIRPPFIGTTSTFGNSTVFLFGSGDVSIQMSIAEDGIWGNNVNATQNAPSFGIQNGTSQGFPIPANYYQCEQAVQSGFFNKTGLPFDISPGSQFEIYVGAACPEGQSRKCNTYECVNDNTNCNSGSSMVATWTVAARFVADLLF